MEIDVTGRSRDLVEGIAAAVALLALLAFAWQDPRTVAMATLIVVLSCLVPFLAGIIIQALARRSPLPWWVPRGIGGMMAVAAWIFGGQPLLLGASPAASIPISVLLWAWACSAGASSVLWVRGRRSPMPPHEKVSGEV
jgi:hypothetical protein